MKNAIQVKLNVTPRDIQRGIERDCTRCPVALALRRHFPTANTLYVLQKYAVVQLTPRGKYLTAQMPERVSTFIASFDVGLPVRSESMKFNLKFEPRNPDAART